MNGKHGDHPVTDILAHKIDVYGTEGSALFRKIAELSSRNEVYDWWEKEIGWEAKEDEALPKLKDRYEKLLQRAKEGGWEIN
jgi:hypothetical protein